MFKVFIQRWFWLVVLLTSGMAAINAYVDPLWVFAHHNASNQLQWGFDERQQKTNWLVFHPFTFDGLLLGSSRVTVLNPQRFQQHRIFNYAASAMKPSEFEGFIENAKQIKGGDFSIIYLGLDFFATNRLHQPSNGIPAEYLATAQEPLYRLGLLLSFDTYKKSKTNVWKPQDDFCDCYDRNMVKRWADRKDAQRQAAVEQDIAGYIKRMSDGAYAYDEEQLVIFRRMKARYPNTRFVVFTTPESLPVYQEMIKIGRQPDYERWVHDLALIFGEVYDFMGQNAVTREPLNYVDATHFEPEVGDMMIERLEGRSAPAGFGIVRH